MNATFHIAYSGLPPTRLEEILGQLSQVSASGQRNRAVPSTPGMLVSRDLGVDIKDDRQVIERTNNLISQHEISYGDTNAPGLRSLEETKKNAERNLKIYAGFLAFWVKQGYPASKALREVQEDVVAFFWSTLPYGLSFNFTTSKGQSINAVLTYDYLKQASSKESNEIVTKL